MSSQNQTKGFYQANIEAPHRSPDLVVFRYLIGLNIICPNLAWFENLILDRKIWTDISRGLYLICVMSQTYAWS